jgi:hypothetical protein
MNHASRDTGCGPEPDTSAPRWRRRIRKAFLIFFTLMVVLGFAGILWTEKGAPGHRYYPALRVPVAVCLFVSWSGLVFSALPSLITLANRSKRKPEPVEQSEDEFKARAEELCRSLPLVAEAGSRERIGAVILAVLFALGAYWGWRRARMPLLLCSLGLFLMMAWEIVRLLVERVEFAIETITFRTMRGRFAYRYAEIENTQPAPGGRMKIWLAGGHKHTINPGLRKQEDLLLILTERQLAQQPASNE